jgi:type II secretory pathway component GspD/PulD (secretin)
MFLWIYGMEAVCRAQEPLPSGATAPATTEAAAPDRETLPAPSTAAGPGQQIIMPSPGAGNMLQTPDQAPGGNQEPAQPSMPATQRKAPLAPGTLSPGKGPASPIKGQSLPKAEKGKEMIVSPSAPFPQAGPGSQVGPGLPGGQMSPFNPMSPVPSTRQTMGSAPQRGMVTLNFDDADVFTIIQTIFGTVLRVNYVVDPRIKGRVTFRAVAPVPIDNVLPLMEVILRLNGIGVVEESGLYRLVPISDISREPSPVSYGRDPEKIQVKGKAMLQVVPVIYVQSSDVLKLITPFASNNAVLIDVPKGNQIIIVDTDANIRRMLKLIEIFDNERLVKTKPQVFVYSVQNSKAKDIANVLQQTFLGGKATTGGSASSGTGTGAQTTAASPVGAGASGAFQGSHSQVSTGGQIPISDFTKFITDEVTNSIIILSTPEEYMLIKDTIDKIDIIPRQVVIEGLVAQVTLTDNLSLGLSAWIKGSIGNINVGGGVGGASLTGDVSKPSGTGLALYGIDGVGNLQFLIAAMATDSKAKLLATPHIIVSDNKEAKIQIGQSVPIVTSETFGSSTVAPQRTIQYRDIGIILKVKPRVNEGGLVNLEIYQEVSTYSTIPLYAGELQIVLNKNDATTNVVVQDGQTIVIGGLIREDTTKSKSGVPFLSSIPYIGWIFGGWIDNKERTEIIILLTPRVVKNQQEAGDVTNHYINNMVGESKGRINKKDLVREK